MKESEIKNALVLLYDRRLKSLLSYKDRQFTEELVEYMFRLFGQISERPERSEFKATLTGYMASVLAYPKNAFRGLRDQALLLLTLNEYVKECYLNLYDAPATGANEPDYRALLGTRFKESLRTFNAGRLPRFQYNNTVSQLRHVTELRNRVAHPVRQGQTLTYDRYQILEAFDTLLCYLLYTFYHLTLNRQYTLQHLSSDH